MRTPKQWRSRVEDAERVAREFPALAGMLKRPESRRQVLRLMAASLALGGLPGCDPGSPDGHYVPAVNQAPEIIPGIANHYATAFVDGGAAAGIIVTQDMGRPIKVEGNPAHPGSLGATSAFGQALILDFYDPDRAAGVMENGQPATWQGLLRAVLPLRAALDAKNGAGLRILTEPTVSPTMAATVGRVLKRWKGARWHQWESAGRDDVAAGVQLAYGQALDVVPHVGTADVILALDSDLLGGAPGHLAHARDFASRRNPARGRMSRVYAAEPFPTLIGSAADHRIVADPRELHAAVAALAAAVLGGTAPADAPGWVAAALDDLRTAGPHALVHAGPSLPPELQALVHQVNERLGGRGTTFDLLPTVQVQPPTADTGMAALMDDMAAGRVDALLILGGNPAYAARGFREALRRVRFSLSSAPAPDETARATTWFVPQTHLFEQWGDARAHDGTVAIQQPQSLPLYGGRSALTLLGLLAGDLAPIGDLSVVRQTWRDHMDDDAWADALANGVVPGTAGAPVATPPLAPRPVPAVPARQALSLLVRPDPSLGDGRWANNAWMQELPRPASKVVWDNPLSLAPATAGQLGLVNGDVVALELGGATVSAPVWVQPGQAPGCVVAWLGGGRTAAGEVGNGVGVDVTPLRDRDGTPTLRKTGKHVLVASTDHHNVLEVDREAVDEVVRHGTLAEFTANPAFLHGSAEEPSIYGRAETGGVAWGMSVDLNACIGCNSCVVACMAENNVPVVGKEQVSIGREMHWLRIDRYYEGSADAPETLQQPMLCMHCENAPCEPVCPVEAAVHDSEGLNLQVYNRCIGTRFCSNNCPYKVRRFNFGAWAAEEQRPPIARNPDVTVRSRGVMEKCTFCVQRIAAARIAHDRDGTKEEAVTACQAACPTQVFAFGDIHDPGSEVSARKHSPLDFALLADQNTRPRLTYEARIQNLNPALKT